MVLKLYSEVEAKCLDSLMRDLLRPFVPEYHGLVTRGEHCYIRMEDLLSGLKRPVIMDCKMGVRYVCLVLSILSFILASISDMFSFYNLNA